MARSAIPPVKPAEWLPERGMRELGRLLIELDELEKCNHLSGADGEISWKQKSINCYGRAFSGDSENHRNLRNASSAGYYSMLGESDDEQNFRDRLKAYRIATTSAIADLRMSMPEPEIKGVYEGGDEYQFCRDLRSIIQQASKEVIVIDPYLDQNLFDLYVESLAPSTKIRILTANLKNSVLIIAQQFATSRTDFELRTTPNIHDRAIFIDDRCWVIGQSIKDAAKKKPTYVIEFGSDLMKPVYETVWTSGTQQAKSQ